MGLAPEEPDRPGLPQIWGDGDGGRRTHDGGKDGVLEAEASAQWRAAGRATGTCTFEEGVVHAEADTEEAPLMGGGGDERAFENHSRGGDQQKRRGSLWWLGREHLHATPSVWAGGDLRNPQPP